MESQKQSIPNQQDGKDIARDPQQSPINTNGSNSVKDPNDWVTGNEPMTGAQRSYLKTLITESGEELDENLTKAEASKKIHELQQKTGKELDDHG